MKDEKKTKARLIDELKELRKEVAERRATAEAIGESEKLFRALAESTTAQITIVQDDHYVYANQAFLDYFFVELEDLHLLNPEDMMMGSMGPESMQLAKSAWESATTRGESRFRFEYQDREGSWFQTHVVMMEHDEKPSVMVTTFDITDLKLAQTEMYRADKMAALGQIIAGVAHEINNPNNFIYFNLPILKKYIEAIRPMLEFHLAEEPDLKILNMSYETFIEDVYKLLENMEHGSKRITGIVSELKNYVHSDEDAATKTEAVSAVIDRVMALVDKQVRKMVKRFEVEVAEGLPDLKMNPGKIEQVLINLVINAGQAANKYDSWVKLSARSDPKSASWIEILVEDNGSGIPKDIRDRIFEPFFTSKGREAGTGLGLSITERIIEEHGGTISVDSTPGEGTTFTIRLPAQKT